MVAVAIFFLSAGALNAGMPTLAPGVDIYDGGYLLKVAGESAVTVVDWNNDNKKDLVIDLYNEAGQLVMAWKVYSAWPSSYSAMTDFDATESRVAIESITLEHEGWERDTDISEPTEPTISE